MQQAFIYALWSINKLHLLPWIENYQTEKVFEFDFLKDSKSAKMGKKKGKDKNKLARMSEEERLRYLQHRAELEEEAKRRKQQLISTFMKVEFELEVVWRGWEGEGTLNFIGKLRKFWEENEFATVLTQK